MKNISILLAIVIIAMFSSCSGGKKKVLVMASGKVQVNGNTVTLEPGTTHNELAFEPDGDSVIVVSPSGSAGFPVKEPGLYLLNLKKDTLVGSYQRTGSDNSQQVISQENLRTRLDSLSQLMTGTNVNEAAKNYNIPPFRIARITGNTEAQVVGPYLKMPGSFDPSKEHEVYKFYTNKEMQEIVGKLQKMVF
jgi:hypothetical protein